MEFPFWPRLSMIYCVCRPKRLATNFFEQIFESARVIVTRVRTTKLPRHFYQHDRDYLLVSFVFTPSAVKVDDITILFKIFFSYTVAAQFTCGTPKSSVCGTDTHKTQLFFHWNQIRIGRGLCPKNESAYQAAAVRQSLSLASRINWRELCRNATLVECWAAVTCSWSDGTQDQNCGFNPKKILCVSRRTGVTTRLGTASQLWLMATRNGRSGEGRRGKAVMRVASVRTRMSNGGRGACDKDGACRNCGVIMADVLGKLPLHDIRCRIGVSAVSA